MPRSWKTFFQGRGFFTIRKVCSFLQLTQCYTLFTRKRKERFFMTTEGFIKLPRSLLDWQWFDDDNTFRVYMTLMLCANWKDTRWHELELKRGQLVTSYPSIAEKCGLTERQVRTAFSHLKRTGDITVRATPNYSVITLVNYDMADNGAVGAAEKPAAPAPVGREELVRLYGNTLVTQYEQEFYEWKRKKGITADIPVYPTIAKWLDKDEGKPAPSVQPAASDGRTPEMKLVWNKVVEQYHTTVDK